MDSRAFDADREHAVARLREGWMAGAVSTDTFEVRLGLALSATRLRDLSRLLDDLRRPKPARRPLCAARYEVEIELVPHRPVMVIGRHASCDVVCDDDAVSRGHALIYRVRKRWRVRDLESTNGTWLNGGRLESATAIRPGDVLRAGTTDLLIS